MTNTETTTADLIHAARRRATVLHSLADMIDEKRNAMTTFDAVAVEVLLAEAAELRSKAAAADAGCLDLIDAARAARRFTAG